MTIEGRLAIVLGAMAAVVMMAFAARHFLGTGPAAEGRPLPELSARVADETGTLTRDQVRDLLGQLEYLELRKNSHVSIVLVDSTEPESIEEFAIKVGEACAERRKGAGDCTLIVVSKSNGHVWIEVGQDLAGALPGSKTKVIVAENMAPQFRAGDWFGGLQGGLRQIEAAVLFGPPADPDAPPSGYDPLEDPWFWALTAAGLILGIGLRWWLHTHGFVCGVLGLVAGGGLLAIADLLLHDVVLGIFGAILLATIAMGLGWFWAYLAINLLLEIVLGAIFGGGGGGGVGGGGGGFGGGGASGSW